MLLTSVNFLSGQDFEVAWKQANQCAIVEPATKSSRSV